jgi:hypothetical protein
VARVVVTREVVVVVGRVVVAKVEEVTPVVARAVAAREVAMAGGLSLPGHTSAREQSGRGGAVGNGRRPRAAGRERTVVDGGDGAREGGGVGALDERLPRYGGRRRRE